ncbi:MAG: hypothetical protein PQ964_01170 [Methanobacteriaceae archaeon]|jgi:hypothetical protein
MKQKPHEKECYEPIKAKLEEILKMKFGDNFHLEITADKEFSNKLKAEVPSHREIIFSFFKDIRPDITGFVKEDSSVQFIVIEIKNKPIKLDDIFQIKKYAVLFNAKHALLVSSYEIPEEIKRLNKVTNPYLLSGGYGYEHIIIVHYDAKKEHLGEWYEKNPFED